MRDGQAMNGRFFLSYRFEQKDLARRIMTALAEAGYEYEPFSRDIGFEPNNRDIVKDAISACNHCIILAEPAEIPDSPWIPYLIGVADAWERPVLIVSSADSWQWPETVIRSLARIVQFPRTEGLGLHAQRRRVSDVLNEVTAA